MSSYKKTTYKKKSSKNDSLAKKAYDLVKHMKKPERKFCDTSVGAAAVTNAGTIQWVSSISEGSDYNQRLGINVNAESVTCKFVGYTNTNPASQPHAFRFLMVEDKDQSGTAPTVADILEQATTTSQLNHINTNRFKVIIDKLFPVTTNASANSMVCFHEFRKLKHKIRWSNSTTGTKEGHIYTLVISDTATATEEPDCYYEVRLRYSDS